MATLKSLRATLLRSPLKLPVNGLLIEWLGIRVRTRDITLCRARSDQGKGDIDFLIFSSELIAGDVCGRFSKVLILLGGHLPKGPCWGPYVSELVDGSEEIVLSLLGLQGSVDSCRVGINVRACYS